MATKTKKSKNTTTTSSHPPPRDHHVFVQKWEELIPILELKPNFSAHTYTQLEMLCDLYVDYYELSEIIRKQGYTDKASRAQYKVIKTSAHVSQRNTVIKQIYELTKILGLSQLAGGNGKPKKSKEEDNEW